jgi:hypothetical protein
VQQLLISRLKVRFLPRSLAFQSLTGVDVSGVPQSVP